MCGEKRITDAKGKSLPRLRELLIGGLAGGSWWSCWWRSRRQRGLVWRGWRRLSCGKKKTSQQRGCSWGRWKWWVGGGDALLLMKKTGVGDVVMAKAMIEENRGVMVEKPGERLIFYPLYTQSSCSSIFEIHSYLKGMEEGYPVFIGDQS